MARKMRDLEAKFDAEGMFDKDFIGIKDKSRVSQHGEVFTPANITKDMMDMEGIEEESYSVKSVWLEPACGNGNFLTRMVVRKMDGAFHDPEYADNKDLGFVTAMTNIYGIDIQADNVMEARQRMLEFCKASYEELMEKEMDSNLEKCMAKIFDINIICGNSLTNESWAIKKETSKRTRRSKKSSDDTETPKYTVEETADALALQDWQFDGEKVTRKVCMFSDLSKELGSSKTINFTKISKIDEFSEDDITYNDITAD